MQTPKESQYKCLNANTHYGTVLLFYSSQVAELDIILAKLILRAPPLQKIVA